MFNSEINQNNFKISVLNIICYLYGISQKDIIITGPIHDKYYILIVLLKDDKITLSKEVLMKQFQFIPNLCNLAYVKKENVIEGIILNRCMLDFSDDNKDCGWQYYSKRGVDDYLPQEG